MVLSKFIGDFVYCMCFYIFFFFFYSTDLKCELQTLLYASSYIRRLMYAEFRLCSNFDNNIGPVSGESILVVCEGEGERERANVIQSCVFDYKIIRINPLLRNFSWLFVKRTSKQKSDGNNKIFWIPEFMQSFTENAKIPFSIGNI